MLAPYGGVTLLLALTVWLLTGAIVGIIAGSIIGADRPAGAFGDIFTGILGALISGAMFRYLGVASDTSGLIWDFFTALFGAIALLAVTEVVRRPHRRNRKD
ncbi:MAG TPA: GlsB/YeaQ/YmgE family stress response membrane protein [Armatimonadota bacterium]|jgi:uncharacterized membrane protein YeaQ/YmgE (transglycosylase-associated protein family)